MDQLTSSQIPPRAKKSSDLQYEVGRLLLDSKPIPRHTTDYSPLRPQICLPPFWLASREQACTTPRHAVCVRCALSRPRSSSRPPRPSLPPAEEWQVTPIHTTHTTKRASRSSPQGMSPPAHPVPRTAMARAAGRCSNCLTPPIPTWRIPGSTIIFILSTRADPCCSHSDTKRSSSRCRMSSSFSATSTTLLPTIWSLHHPSLSPRSERPAESTTSPPPCEFSRVGKRHVEEMGCRHD